jgi:hypothetical protein
MVGLVASSMCLRNIIWHTVTLVFRAKSVLLTSLLNSVEPGTAEVIFLFGNK